MKTAYIIVDLGFGDAGKGSIVDYLAQTRDIQAIVRYTGGPHAAHHVVRQDGVSHAFCQFGATFQQEVRYHLAQAMIVKPENLMYEGWALESKGVPNPFARLSINPTCRLVTSYQAMLCQMKEVARGGNRYGTVGIGVGEAVLESEQATDLALRVGDLYEPETLRQKLFWHFENKQRQAHAILRDTPNNPDVRQVYENFMEQVRLKDVLASYQQFAGTLPVTLCTDVAFIERTAEGPGDIVFEGAHAALLDRDHGYYPYVAKTDTTTREAVNILGQSNFCGNIITLGVVRALGYRHGPGPFVTEDERLSGLFTEIHNKANEWQGNVRYGWFDLLAIRHGMQLNSRVVAVALTMLDQLSKIRDFQVCLSYEYLGSDVQSLEKYFEFTTTRSGRIRITGIKPVPTGRTDTLSRLLFDCVPGEWLRFDGQKNCVEDFILFLESRDGLGVPIQIVSTGPTMIDKKERVLAENLR
jgi:adenylosuccinate synthase